jgi:uncharacterized surface protein with fasciclin (FAS1) repeats
MKRFALATAALAVTAFVVPASFGCASCGCAASKDKTADHAHEKQDIVATAKSAGMFGTLLAAADAAGLVETLQGDGPLTVLAPTDEAFAALPDGTVETLLKPENKDQLAEILTYHVIAGKVMAADALEAGTAETVQGGEVEFTKSGDGAQVNGANIVKTDIKASNGVIHVIDAVLLPTE